MKSVTELLERAGELFSERSALSYADETISFAQLRKRSRLIASGLHATGVLPNTPVALYLPKGNSCVVAAFGALYCGAPYSPLDYNCPAARLSAMLQKLEPSCVITDQKGAEQFEKVACSCPVLLFDRLLEGTGEYAFDGTVDTDPAYIMFTSGSTGTPKGVAISHAAVLDYAEWAVNTFGITKETRFGQQSGFHFDNSVFHIFASVYSGAELVIIPDALLMYPQQLTDFIAEREINFIFWAPTVLMSIANCGALEATPLPKLKTVLFGGEVMPAPQLEHWQNALPECRFGNMYGPTEITDVCCYYVVPAGQRIKENVPIGRARENMRVYLLDEDLSPVKDGEIGEIYVAGTGVALGYWNESEQTIQRFVKISTGVSCSERVYKTGDLAFADECGVLHFCGRADSQIKLRGNRIELSDVESAAQRLPGIGNACVLFDKENEKIVLFLEVQESLALRKVNLQLRELLPSYMLPGKLICLEKFPVNKNRKVDRIQLKEMIND